MKTKHIKYMGKTVSVSHKVGKVITESDRKMRYQAEDLKREEIEVDHEAETVTFIPSREDSYDRLLADKSAGFATGEKSVEDLVVQNLLGEELQDVLRRLTPTEQRLIRLIYWKGKSERETAVALGISQTAIHKKKKKILCKLRKLLPD